MAWPDIERRTEPSDNERRPIPHPGTKHLHHVSNCESGEEDDEKDGSPQAGRVIVEHKMSLAIVAVVRHGRGELSFVQ